MGQGLGFRSADVQHWAGRAPAAGSPETVRRWADGGRLPMGRDGSATRVIDGVGPARFAKERALGGVHGIPGDAPPTSVRNAFTGIVSALTMDGVRMPRHNRAQPCVSSPASRAAASASRSAETEASGPALTAFRRPPHQSAEHDLARPYETGGVLQVSVGHPGDLPPQQRLLGPQQAQAKALVPPAGVRRACAPAPRSSCRIRPSRVSRSLTSASHIHQVSASHRIVSARRDERNASWLILQSTHGKSRRFRAVNQSCRPGGTYLFSEQQPHLRRPVDLSRTGWTPVELLPEGSLEIAATCTVAQLSLFAKGAAAEAAPLFEQCRRAFLASFKIWNMATVPAGSPVTPRP